MKKLREMKENNKGFSLVELIVVIAIMVVLIAVLGSAILGYVEKANHSKDVSALDAVDTAMGLMVADPNSDYATAKDGCTLAELMAIEKNKVVVDTLVEVFAKDGDVYKFNNASDAFDGLEAGDVQIYIENGVVSIIAPVNKKEAGNYDPYVAGPKYDNAKDRAKTFE